MWQYMGSQRVRQNLVTEQQQEQKKSLEVQVMQKNQIIWLVLPLSIYGLVTNILLINGFECSIVSSQVDSVPFSSTLNVFCNDFCSTGKEKGKKWSFHNFWTVSIVLPLTHVIKYLFKLKYMTHC